MGFQPASREYPVFADGEMRIAASLARAASRPVFFDAIDLRLHLPDISPHHRGDKGGILHESARHTPPARLGCQIGLGGQGGPESEGQVFPLDGPCEIGHDSRIEGGGQTKRRRPL